jgi:hypothetical protein
MKRNNLKLVMLSWALLGIVMVRIDRWYVNLSLCAVSCLLGAIVLTARSTVEERERREAKYCGMLLIGCGAFITLLVACAIFILGGI